MEREPLAERVLEMTLVGEMELDDPARENRDRDGAYARLGREDERHGPTAQKRGRVLPRRFTEPLVQVRSLETARGLLPHLIDRREDAVQMQALQRGNGDNRREARELDALADRLDFRVDRLA